ncbi:MAG: glycosyltransferase family 4 protein [Bacteroidales bacterium]
MKVLMFGWEFPPNISGGLGTACHGLTKGLTSLDGIDLTFIVPKVYGNEDKTGIKLIGAGDVVLSGKILLKQKRLEMRESLTSDQQISAYVTPKHYKKLLEIKKRTDNNKVKTTSPGKLEFAGEYGSSLFDEISRYALVASEITRNESHNIIHAHDWLTYPAGIAAKKVSGNPLIVHVHSTEYDRSGENPNINVYEVERKGMEIADMVITVSDFTRNIVIKKYNINPSKIITVHNAVDTATRIPSTKLYKKGPNYKIVTFLGRITQQKGPEYFIKAAYKVLQKMDNVRFVMAGNGDMMEDMIRCVARLHIADRFHFTGFLKNDDVTRLYAMSDLYVMPSVSEPFGISTLEAMQNNVPVIISKQSGVSEVITHAIKVDFWDIDHMADAIYGILNYPSLGEYMIKNSLKEVNNLRWVKAAERVKEIYYHVARCKAG